MTRYDAYVPRLRRSTGKDVTRWRGLLDHLEPGAGVQFSDLDALLQYLRNVAGEEDGRQGMAGKQTKGAGE